MTETEARTFYRYMSRAEADVVQRTGYLRGGRSGRTYWTDAFYASPEEAQGLLALAVLPECRVAFTIRSEPELVLEATRVRPKGDQPGGGVEWMTYDKVGVEVISVDNLE